MSKKSHLFIAGIDEAGRGPLAGPVFAGCVILPETLVKKSSPLFPLELLADSKKLSEKKREKAYQAIENLACFGSASVSEKTIDEINILQATFLAMKKAYENMLEKLPEWCKRNGIPIPKESEIEVIVDGNKVPFASSSCIKAVVKADTFVPCVQAASIVAKVERDRLMREYDLLYPEYGYKRNKGYPTHEHRRICREKGPSPIQRLTFNYD